MADTKEDRIRKRAHKIWEDAGQPEGLHEEHWSQAVAEIEAEDAAPAKAAKPRAAKKTDGAEKPAAKKAPAVKSETSAKKPAARKVKEAPVA
ncbi:DUF2934 domain-containing protein [Rhizobium sp. FKL33]|uniref:DUF2934 domain-containing protein n=1 Tax=Rhizobium sp. FKL33 TaxID=2562307 RepID=UPI0010C0415B|nr:DUF2934 domain-containing protein [Rhizobium sp. FKL33]